MEIRAEQQFGRASSCCHFFYWPVSSLHRKRRRAATSIFARKQARGKMCNASTTCGSGSTACVVDIKRKGGSSASAVPSISNVKATGPFCVKAGTTVTFQSTSKDTGFVLDFGPSSPFDPPGAIIGGSDRSVSVVAKRKGCFKYSAGACTRERSTGCAVQWTLRSL